MNVPLMPSQTSRFWRYSCLIIALGLAAIAVLSVPRTARAAGIVVTTTADTVDAGSCTSIVVASLPGPDGVTSLREAVCAANATAGADTITFGVNGTFGIQIAGNDDAAAQGDLDLRSDITITGNGAANTIIDGGSADDTTGDRVFDVDPLGNCNTSTSCTISISGVTIQRGRAYSGNFNTGGAIFVGSRATVTISDSVIQNSRSVGSTGGGIQNQGAQLTLSNVLMQNNTAVAGGGAIRTSANLNITASSFFNNTAEYGGAIDTSTASGKIVSIATSTFSGNSAIDTAGGTAGQFGNGGAIRSDTDSVLTISNSTFSGNLASQAGGALYLADTSGAAGGGGTYTLNNLTITQNHSDNDNSGAETGGGVRVASGSATITNSIVALNYRGSATTTIDNIPDAFSGANNLTSGDPLLGPLQDNGGPTQTRALLAGSPAYNAGNNATCASTDQRGVARPQGGTCDIGAFEAAPDLVATKSHTGNFTQGQVGSQYTIGIANTGIEATSGIVTVVDSLPAGLTATALAGTGWSCTLATLTCTRSDALAAGSSYPDITLTVNVAANAPASVTNSVTVSNSGDLNTANNTASDPTTISTQPTATPTNTPTDTPTNTPVPPTNTPTDTPTNTPVTPTNTPTDTPTNTPIQPTNTPTDTPTNTPIQPTNTPTDTPTNTPIQPTNTPTDTPTNTPVTPTNTPTATATGTPAATPGVNIAPASVNVAEGGATATYQVVLGSQPSANVTIAIASDGKTNVSPASLLFTSANWNIPQTVTVTAVDDATAQGPHTSTISHSATSADATYNGISIASVTANIADNDTGSSLRLYLPLIERPAPVLPDLVVERIILTGTTIQVVVGNQGAGPVTGSFWVDVYINPSPVPTAVNQIWQELASQGLVWGVAGSALPLAPGEQLTLSLGDGLYHPELSVFSGTLAAGTVVYAQVDSANDDSSYGGVLESDDQIAGSYNNISSAVVPASGARIRTTPAAARDRLSLPARPLR